MVSLWPSRTTETSAADMTATGGSAGTIEMKGSKRVDTPRSIQKSVFSWPVSTLRSKPPAQTEIQPLAENGSTSLQLSTYLPETPFLETVVRADTPTVLTCSPRGVQITTREASQEGGDCCSSLAVAVNEPEHTAEDQGFHEVKLVFRVPRSQSANSPPQCSSSGRSLEELEEELAAKERQRQRATDALATKNQECEDLLRIVRELTESRNKLSSFKSLQSERLADLHHEYMRVLRVADLSRAISKENLSKTAQLTQRLNRAEEELAHQKLVNQQTKERYARLKLENLELREKICLLERLDMFAYRHESACMVEFKHYHLKETY